MSDNNLSSIGQVGATADNHSDENPQSHVTTATPSYNGAQQHPKSTQDDPITMIPTPAPPTPSQPTDTSSSTRPAPSNEPPPWWIRRTRSSSSSTSATTLQLARPSQPHRPAINRHGSSGSGSREPNRHSRSIINLEDHSEDHNLSASRGHSCWASGVRVLPPVIVSAGGGTTIGSTADGAVAAGGAGAYVVWRCCVGLLGSGVGGAEVEMAKRYSEFDALRIALVRAFPHAVAMIPPLPRKSLVSRFRPHFLEARRVGLQHFLSCVLLNPEFAASPILRDFVFS